jgi:hypothetical protein
MRRLTKFFCASFMISIAFLSSRCDDESNPTQNLPGGCQAQGVYAIAVLESNVACTPTNAFKDTQEILGPPDAHITGPGKLEFDGFLSLGVEGSITLYMGSCIQDLAGPDLRVHQFVASEAVEVQVSQNQNGPFTSLGTQPCTGICDFDLAGSGLNAVRVVRLVDQSRTQFAIAACDNVGPSPGADVDAVEVLH